MSVAILTAGTIAVYSQTFSVPLLFDDRPAIDENSTIRHLSTALWPPARTTTTGRPILNLSLAINYAVSGTKVWSYHALNLAIHALSGMALFGVIRRTLVRGSLARVIGDVGEACRPLPKLEAAAFGLPSVGSAEEGDAAQQANATILAFGAALLWTLHPLQTESVNYVVQREDSLMGLFYLLTVYCFIRGVDAADHSRRLWFDLSFFACLLGMATKEVLVSAPLIVLLYDRTFVAGSFRESWRRRRWLHVSLAATWLPLAGLVASTGWNRNGQSGFDVGITPWAYWLTQFEAITRYLWLSVWPHPLVFDYGTFWVKRPVEVIPSALLVSGLGVAVLVGLWRRPALGFLGAWFFAILAPTSIMPGRVQMIVEHRMYLPLAAVMTLAVIGIHAAVRRRSWLVFAALALGLGMLTARRNEDYRSELTIWRDTVAKRPNNERAHNILGNTWAKVPGRLEDAIAQYQEALRLRPGYVEAHINLGFVLSEMAGRLNDAIAHYQEALRLKPDYPDAHYYLGLAWSKMPGRRNDAIAQFQEALRLQPDYPDAHYHLGLAWSEMPGRLDDAIAQYQEALRLQPDLAEAHNNLGSALAKIPRRLPDAIAQYQEAIRLKPDLAKAHNNLGVAWSEVPGRLNDAIIQYEEALRLDPKNAQAHNNLGIAWAQMPGRLSAAIAQFEEALRLKPDDVETHFNLGVAWSQVPGRLNDATSQFKEALRLNPDFAPAWHQLGDSRLRLGNLPAAAAAFREELRLKPNDPAAQNALDKALQQANAH